MRAASIFWFVFSVGGLVVALLAGMLGLWARPRSRVIRICLASIVVAYAFASLYPVPYAFATWLGRGFHPITRDTVPAGRSIVVLLGSGTRTRADWDDRTLSILDSIGAERTLEAARVFKLLQPDWLISSGGLVDPADDEEAPSGMTMQQTLVALGVPADRIIIEDKSKNTRDEATIIAGLLPSLKVDHVILVTSQIHMRRALGMFRAVGITAIPAIAREPTYRDWTLSVLPTDAGLRLSGLAAHEAAGLLYYWLRGWYR